MRPTKPWRLASAVLIASASVGAYAVAAGTTAATAASHAGQTHRANAGARASSGST